MTRHIRHPHDDHAGESLCGVRLYNHDWAFTSLDHVYNTLNDGTPVPCPACIAQALQTLRAALFTPTTPAPAVALSEPVSRTRDWLDAKMGECQCGASRMLLDGLCSTCYDATHLAEWQEYARAQAARAEAAEARVREMEGKMKKVREIRVKWYASAPCFGNRRATALVTELCEELRAALAQAGEG